MLAPTPQIGHARGIMSPRWTPLLAAFALAAGGQTAPSPTPAGTDDLYSLGQQLFDQYAPPEVKEEYRFPTKGEWDQFAARLQHALDNNSLEELAAFEPEARTALAALRALPGYEDYADWLELRIDEIEAARLAVARPVAPTPAEPGVPRPSSAVPHYDLWLARERGRPVPAAAAALMIMRVSRCPVSCPSFRANLHWSQRIARATPARPH